MTVLLPCSLRMLALNGGVLSAPVPLFEILCICIACLPQVHSLEWHPVDFLKQGEECGEDHEGNKERASTLASFISGTSCMVKYSTAS